MKMHWIIPVCSKKDLGCPEQKISGVTKLQICFINSKPCISTDPEWSMLCLACLTSPPLYLQAMPHGMTPTLLPYHHTGCGTFRNTNKQMNPLPGRTGSEESSSHGVCFVLGGTDLFCLSDHLHWSSQPSLWTLLLQAVHFRGAGHTAALSTVWGSCSTGGSKPPNKPRSEEPGWERQGEAGRRETSDSRGMELCLCVESSSKAKLVNSDILNLNSLSHCPFHDLSFYTAGWQHGQVAKKH